MNTDIRVATSFLDHPKTIRMKMLLGPESIECLLRLWFFVAQNKPDGDLSGLDSTDIEIAAKWTGEPGKFIRCITDHKTQFLDEAEGGFLLHDWEDHNGYASKAGSRKEAAKVASEIRWRKKRVLSDDPRDDSQHKSSKESDDNATASKPQCEEEESAMRKSEKGNAPAPSPVPSPSPVPKHKDRFSEFWSVYPKCENGKKPEKKLAKRQFVKLKGEEIDQAINGALNYAESSGVARGYTKHCFRWLRDENWKEWQEPESRASPAVVGSTSHPGNKPLNTTDHNMQFMAQLKEERRRASGI